MAGSGGQYVHSSVRPASSRRAHIPGCSRVCEAVSQRCTTPIATLAYSVLHAPVLNRDDRCTTNIVACPDCSVALVHIEACWALHHDILDVHVAGREEAGRTVLRVEDTEADIVIRNWNSGYLTI